MTHKKINITFITPNLFAGGAERIISFLAKEFNREQFNVTFIVIGYEKDASYDTTGINTIFLNQHRVLNATIPLFKNLKKHKPDVVFSVIEHLNTLLAYQSICFPKTKFIAREVNVLSIIEQFSIKQNSIIKFLYNQRFKFFDAIICQSQDMLVDIKKHYNVPEEKLHVINNPITDGFSVKSKQPKHQTLKLISVGRLAKQKGHERILYALQRLTIPFHYTLIGSGPEKEHLEQTIIALDLKDKVTLVNFTKDINTYLSENDLYLQGSYVEGFPNALIESCAVGTPVLAFDAPGGLNEIIINNVNGLIVYNEEQFINTINNYNSDTFSSPEIISESVYSKYRKGIILDQYERMIIETYEGK